MQTTVVPCHFLNALSKSVISTVVNWPAHQKYSKLLHNSPVKKKKKSMKDTWIKVTCVLFVVDVTILPLFFLPSQCDIEPSASNYGTPTCRTPLREKKDIIWPDFLFCFYHTQCAAYVLYNLSETDYPVFLCRGHEL